MDGEATGSRFSFPNKSGCSSFFVRPQVERDIGSTRHSCSVLTEGEREREG